MTAPLINSDGTIPPGALMILYMSDELDMDLRLPELYWFLGEEKTMSFLKVFGGRTVEVPPVKDVRNAFLTVSAYLRCEELSEKNCDDDVVAQVAAEMDMTEKRVRDAWATIGSMLSRLGRFLRDAVEQTH